MRRLPSILITSLFAILFVTQAYAVTIPNPLPGTFLDNFNRLTSLIKPVVTLVFLGVFFWGGFTIQTSGPNSDKMMKGWKIILGAVVGLIVIAVGPSIVELVGDLLGLGTIVDFT